MDNIPLQDPMNTITRSRYPPQACTVTSSRLTDHISIILKSLLMDGIGAKSSPPCKSRALFPKRKGSLKGSGEGHRNLLSGLIFVQKPICTSLAGTRQTRVFSLLSIFCTVLGCPCTSFGPPKLPTALKFDREKFDHDFAGVRAECAHPGVRAGRPRSTSKSRPPSSHTKTYYTQKHRTHSCL